MWGAILLFGCALATLACFGAIFCLALAEYRRVDPVDESSPWGDVIDPVALRRATEAAEAYLEGKAARTKLAGGGPSKGTGGRALTGHIAHDGEQL